MVKFVAFYPQKNIMKSVKVITNLVLKIHLINFVKNVNLSMEIMSAWNVKKAMRSFLMELEKMYVNQKKHEQILIIIIRLIIKIIILVIIDSIMILIIALNAAIKKHVMNAIVDILWLMEINYAY